MLPPAEEINHCDEDNEGLLCGGSYYYVEVKTGEYYVEAYYAVDRLTEAKSPP